ncbi:unnamed protein product [Lepeophtheirus salmonis]|uniref:(salmon louse) hypothetical protein n=1 Tax=Lepeophtheirus salmonis TaxID=72036 RepID=A0A7R8H0I1_LEPSM|nr:unnamed protein product [Lepeophtheirus salmonis]CAF2790354.1 unnamed protein product [Lepeophtheirus salmonis]
MSVYYCSQNQAVAGIVETANFLFDRKWKYHLDNPNVIDLNTVPHNSQTQQTGKAILAQTLSEIVEVIMTSSDVVITNHDDGNFNSNNSLLVSKKDQSKLENAPINHLAAERYVGSVQYAVSIGGACNLTPASNRIVKAKLIDLIEFKPVDEMNKFRSLVRQDGELVAMWKRWNDALEKLEEMGLNVKEAQNKNLDRKRNAGPFTKPDEVDEFTNSNISEKAKIE